MTDTGIEAVQALLTMRPFDVPPATGGVYIARLAEHGQIKVGCAVDVAARMVDIRRELALSATPDVLALLPGYRQVESDLHARFAPDLARASGPLSTEIYRMTSRVLEVVERVRALGFSELELAAGMQRGATCDLRFDNGQTMALLLTYLPLLGFGEVVPQHMLIRPCRGCGQARSSLEFLGRYDIERLGRARREYVVLSDAGDRICCHCRPTRLVVPYAKAFPGGVASLRLGLVLDREEKEVLGYDRDFDTWRPLKDHGIRRMAKDLPEDELAERPPSARAWREGESSLLRLQPYSLRPRRPVAPGYDAADARQLSLWDRPEPPEAMPQVF